MQHAGNQTSSPEEAQCVIGLVSDLVQDGVTWVNAKGDERRLSLDDILIIAPYNAQVAEIERRFPGLASERSIGFKVNRRRSLSTP